MAVVTFDPHWHRREWEPQPTKAAGPSSADAKRNATLASMIPLTREDIRAG